MSAGHLSRHPSQSARSQGSRGSGRDLTSVQQATTTYQPADIAHAFKPAAATASFFLHAQRDVIFCLHHDTLAVERRFERHNEDVLLIAADNVSERGAGRLVVSYDASLTAIVWDLFTGDEVARFASYEPIYVATWMRDGTIAFGNAQGSIILFDPHTSEHQAARTIFDPVTALAPAADCKTFAIGYLNGSILIATLQPFTILHTLNTSRGPSPITGLAWHGSSSKQKTEMLATQTSDGDLRVWSIAKPPVNEAPRIIRILGAPEIQTSTKSWFAWSKNGRIIQYTDDETRSWDVRTKKVSHARVPVFSDVTAVTNYGPTATLFTIGPEQSIQQYDLNPNGQPIMVANVQHAPVNAPPTPPDSAPRETPPPIEPPTVPLQNETSSEDEGPVMSPLQKIAQEMDQIEEEMRDRVGPLSPVSSRASSRASMSSAGSYGRKSRSRPRDRGYSSKASDNGSEHTTFSMGSTMQTGRESMSIRSMSSATSSRYHGASSRYLAPREQPPPPPLPAEPQGTKDLDLFPYVRARLSEVKFRTPQFGNNQLTPDVLRQEMLSVVFGWEDDIEPLIRLEMSQHRKGTAGRVLLGKWLGDDGSDQLAEMMASQSMTSTDWMLLAMTSQMGQGSQKQVGEAFVRRLLETDEIHPAVAILLGLNEPNEAVEAYVSRKCFMEAVLLTCLHFPNDWQRQSYLLRKWGETTVAHGQAELAVRCFSCTSVDTSEPWFSPRAQNEVQAAQQNLAAMASPTSPPSAGPSSRIATKNAGLTKLVTTFEKPSTKATLNSTIGVTPIIDSAISPGAEKPWKRSTSRGLRDPSSARTATPGGYNRRRGPSAEPGTRSALDADATPLVGGHSRPGSRMSNKDTPSTAVKSQVSNALPSPAPGTFNSDRARSRNRDASKDRNHNGLQIQMMRTEEADEPALQTASTTSRTQNSVRSTATSSRDGFSPLLTDGSSASLRGRHIDRYIDSLSQANQEAEQLRAENRSRTQSRDGRSHSKARRRTGSSSQSDVAYIKPSKRSPSSPAAMHTDDAFKYQGSRESYERDDGSEVTSSGESKSGRVRARSRGTSRARASSQAARRAESPDDSNRLRSANKAAAARVASRSRNRLPSPERQDSGEDRGRGHSRKTSHGAPRSPSSPSPMKYDDQDDNTSETIAARRRRQRSTSRRGEDRRGDDRSTTRARSSSRKPTKFTLEEPWSANPDRTSAEFPGEDPKSPASSRASLSRKQLAQKELEERRLSLARRQPSVPPVPHPSEYSSNRPSMSPRALSNDAVATLSTAAYGADPIGQRSRTADPETMHSRSKSASGAMPSIGLPATPRAMRHPRYMSAEPDERDAIPAVPALPEGFAGQQTAAGAPESPAEGANLLLPSSVYGQKGGALARSASAPPEQAHPARPRAGSVRRPSKDASVAVVPEEPAPPPLVLPELQHLAIPPPPPPPPAPPSGVINISLDGSAPAADPLRHSPPSVPGASPSSSRRGRGSVSGEAVSGLFKNMRERMRADSRSRAKSPPMASADAPAPLSFTPSPYETKLPGQWGAGGSAAASPAVAKGEYMTMAAAATTTTTTTPPLPPPPVPQLPAQLAQGGKSSPPRMTGYRNPREIQRQYVDGAGRI